MKKFEQTSKGKKVKEITKKGEGNISRSNTTAGSSN
jgi:hypothetical protein